MKQFYCIAFFILCVSFNILTMAYRWNGKFENESGSVIMEILNDTLVIRSYNEEEPLAVCKTREVSDSFLEIQSVVNPNVAAFKDIHINYEKQSDQDSVSNAIVNFRLPKSSHQMKISIYCGTNLYAGTTNNGECSISLNKYSGNYPNPFTFFIEPLYYVESNPEGQYYGVLYLMYPMEIKYNNTDIITIHLPSVTVDLFEGYFIRGEYIHFIEGGLEWRGDKYYKQIDSISDSVL